MPKKVPAEFGRIIEPKPGNVVEIEFEGDATGTVWVMLSRDELKRLTYDDDDVTAEEMLHAASSGLDDTEGWGAPDMEVYDNIESAPPPL